MRCTVSPFFRVALGKSKHAIFAYAVAIISDPARPVVFVEPDVDMSSVCIERVLQQFGDDLREGSQNLSRPNSIARRTGQRLNWLIHLILRERNEMVVPGQPSK